MVSPHGIEPRRGRGPAAERQSPRPSGPGRLRGARGRAGAASQGHRRRLLGPGPRAAAAWASPASARRALPRRSRPTPRCVAHRCSGAAATKARALPSYWPWVQLIRSYVHDSEPSTLLAEMGAGASAIAEVVSDVRERLPGLQPVSPLEPEQARFRLFDSVTRFLANASQRKPLAIVLDDLHWADKPSLLLLQFLARRAGGLAHPGARQLPRRGAAPHPPALRDAGGAGAAGAPPSACCCAASRTPGRGAADRAHHRRGTPRGPGCGGASRDRGQPLLRARDRAPSGRRGPARPARRGALLEPLDSAGHPRGDRPAHERPLGGVQSAAHDRLGDRPRVRSAGAGAGRRHLGGRDRRASRRGDGGARGRGGGRQHGSLPLLPRAGARDASRGARHHPPRAPPPPLPSTCSRGTTATPSSATWPSSPITPSRGPTVAATSRRRSTTPAGRRGAPARSVAYEDAIPHFERALQVLELREGGMSCCAAIC